MAQAESTESPDYRLKDTEKPYRDPDLLRRLYWEEEMDTRDLADEFGCSGSTVRNWMERHDIPRRTAMEWELLNDPNGHEPLYTDRRGRVGWWGTDGRVFVHRLLAVALYGYDEVCDMQVHHGVESGNLPAVQCSWANWPGNLELVSGETHLAKHHTKFDEDGQQEIADMYENTDMSSRDVADEFGCTSTTVLRYHGIFYGDEDE